MARATEAYIQTELGPGAVVGFYGDRRGCWGCGCVGGGVSVGKKS